MNSFNCYVRLDGPDFIARATAYRAASNEAMRRYRDFSASVGAEGFQGPLPGALPRFFMFAEGAAPKGWVKSARATRKRPATWTPPEGSDAEVALLSLPASPDEAAVFPGYPAHIRWTDAQTQYGRRFIGSAFHPFSLGWGAQEPPVFFARIPDVERSLEDFWRDHPKATIEEPAGFTWPEGLTRLTDAEYRLIIAQAEVDEERRRAAAAAGRLLDGVTHDAMPVRAA
jgi:hypothetical protein